MYLSVLVLTNVVKLLLNYAVCKIDIINKGPSSRGHAVRALQAIAKAAKQTLCSKVA